MERSARRSLRFFQRIAGSGMGDLGDQTCRNESLFDVVSLEVDIRVNFVSYAIIALVAIEADIVRGGADPNGLASHLEGRFPNSEVIARGHHLNWLSVRPTVILRAAEKI